MDDTEQRLIEDVRELAKLLKRAGDMQEQLDEQKKEIEKWRGRLRQAETQKENYKAAVRKQTKTIRELRAATAQCEAEISSLRQCLDKEVGVAALSRFAKEQIRDFRDWVQRTDTMTQKDIRNRALRAINAIRCWPDTREPEPPSGEWEESAERRALVSEEEPQQPSGEWAVRELRDGGMIANTAPLTTPFGGAYRWRGKRLEVLDTSGDWEASCHKLEDVESVDIWEPYLMEAEQ